MKDPNVPGLLTPTVCANHEFSFPILGPVLLPSHLVKGPVFSFHIWSLATPFPNSRFWQESWFGPPFSTMTLRQFGMPESYLCVGGKANAIWAGGLSLSGSSRFNSFQEPGDLYRLRQFPFQAFRKVPHDAVRGDADWLRGIF